jgi:hypothetical protein
MSDKRKTSDSRKPSTEGRVSTEAESPRCRERYGNPINGNYIRKWPLNIRGKGESEQHMKRNIWISDGKGRVL